MITEPFDFKSNTDGDKGLGNSREPVRIPRAVEVSGALWKPARTEDGLDPQRVELPPTVIPIQAGMVFERFEAEEEESGASEE